jgi:hypothetical protein
MHATLSFADAIDVAGGYRRNRRLNDELQTGEAAARTEGPWLLVCECGADDCAEPVELSTLEYEAARSHPRLYVVAPGHGTPGVTSTVTGAPGRFDLVELLRDEES